MLWWCADLSAGKLPKGAKGCRSARLPWKEGGTLDGWRDRILSPAPTPALAAGGIRLRGVATLLPMREPKGSAELPLPENSGLAAVVDTCKHHTRSMEGDIIAALSACMQECYTGRQLQCLAVPSCQGVEKLQAEDNRRMHS